MALTQVDQGLLAQKPPLQSLGVTLASNALTIASQAFSLAFKTSLTSGAVTTITGSPSALTIPSGATLGTISAVASSLIVAVLNNAGTLEYTVQNIAGGSDMSETGLITTVAITAGATANNVWYSNTARTSVPYSIIYRIDSTQATNTAWATPFTLLQGVGGQALAAMSSLGYGQTWKTTSYAVNTTYYNTKGKPIVVNARGTFTGADNSFSATIAGLANAVSGGSAAAGAIASVLFLVPANASFSITMSTSVNTGFSANELS